MVIRCELQERSTSSHDSRHSFKGPHPQLSAANLSGEHIVKVELEIMALDNSGISSAILENLREQTAMDPEPQGLPFLDPLVQPYLPFKDELSLADGIVYKGQQAVIPKSMRPALLHTIHKTHFGAGSCIRRAKVSLFWPGATFDNKNKCISCPVCANKLVKRLKSPCLAMIFQNNHGH